MKSAFLVSKGLLCLYDKQNNTWLLVDMEFLFSCSTRHLTRSLRSLVRYRVKHAKRNSTSTRAHVLLSLYIISSVMHTFWSVLTYDLLEDRRIDDVLIKTFFLILYYIKQIDSKLPCVCSVIDHRGRQNVVRTSVTHSAAPRVPLFCSYHILTSSVVYY